MTLEAVGGSQSGRLDIEIEPAIDGLHKVRLDRDGAITPTTFKNPLHKTDLIDSARALDQGLVAPLATRAIGAKLFDALFHEAAAARVLNESMGEHRTRLRIIAGDGDVAAIPWELLFDEIGGNYLARSGSISRWIRVSAEVSKPPRPTFVSGPLRTLIVLADPSHDLNLEAEAEAIKRAFAQAVKDERAEEPDVLTNATISYLQDAVREAEEAKRPFHIIHFAGHTGQEPGNPHSYLRFIPDPHDAEDDGKVSAATFADIVSGPDDDGDLRLVFLNACGTLQASDSLSGKVFPEFAVALILKGVPAIVGTQSPVLDAFATGNAQKFYASLLDGRPVDVALSDVRKRIESRKARKFSNSAIPVCYVARGDGRLVATPLRPKARRRILTTVGLVASAITTVWALGQIGFDAFDFLRGPPPPPVMNGDFNVGVAELQVLGPETEAAVDEARATPVSLFTRLQSAGVLGCEEMEEAPLGTGGRVFECQGPGTVGRIDGDGAQRVAAATEYSAQTNAHLVVYGTVSESEGVVTFSPEIYISNETMNRAEELAGPHPLSLRTYEVRSTNQKRDFRGEVEQLAVDLGALSKALDYYNDPDYPRALEAVNGLLTGGTFELDASLLHLIAGNLYGKLAVAADSKEERLELIDAAESSYQASIDATPGYARGWLGLGEIYYQRGRGDAECAAGSIESSQLDTSITRYESAITEPVSPAAANVDIKASFGIGRNLACLAQAGAGDHWAEAKRRFEVVTDGYELGSEGIEEFASESYSLVAHIEIILASPADRDVALQRSIELNKKAIETNTDPVRIGVFSYLIANAYRELGRDDLACGPLERAVDAENEAALKNASSFDCG